MAVDTNQMAILAEIRVPTLILWGKQDRVLHVDNAALLQQKIPGSRKVLIEEAGHVPMMEKPEETAQLFLDFLREVATSAPNIGLERNAPKEATLPPALRYTLQ